MTGHRQLESCQQVCRRKLPEWLQPFLLELDAVLGNVAGPLAQKKVRRIAEGKSCELTVSGRPSLTLLNLCDSLLFKA
ncbi:MAG TPA: hypothetical protein VMJ34_03255 [Bryobacteraceae bacterium]|nr:hypothetical protein [Bryobacteraceae bacterium]